METQRGGRSEGGWVPETPGKPNVGRPTPIYEDGQAWVQNLLPSYSINSEDKNLYQNTSNIGWAGGYGDNPSLGGNVEMERRVLEGYLPHWSSEGRRSVMSYGSNDHASVSYPMFNSWDLTPQWSDNNNNNNNGVRPNGSILESSLNESILNTMSFGDLLSMNESMTLRNNCGGSTSNGMFLPSWVSSGETSRLNDGQLFNNQEAFRGINQHNNGLYSQGMQNDALTGPLWRTIGTNSLLCNNHANGISAIAPPTPDSWQRIQNNLVSENTLGVNQEVDEQKALQEQKVDHQNQNTSGPVTESSTDKSPIIVDDHGLEKEDNQGIDLNDTPQKKPRKRRYQPKVIRENKPKRTPKPNTPKPPETQGKRKYNRKPKTNTPTIPPETTEPKSTQANNTCKKSLNFDLNGGGLEEEGHASECQEADNQCGQHVDLSQTEESSMKTPLTTAYDLNQTQKQELREYMSLPVKENIDSSQTDINISLEEKAKSADSLSGKEAESSTRKDPCSVQSPNSSPCASSSEPQNRGAKRNLLYTAEPTLNDEVATIIEKTSWQPNHITPNITDTERMCKRKRTNNIQSSETEGTLSTVAASEGINQVGKDHSHAQIEHTASKYYCNSTPEGISGVPNNHAVNVERIKNRDQLMTTWADISRLKKKRGTSGGARVRDSASLSGTASAAKGEHGRKVDGMNNTVPSHEGTNATPRPTGESGKQDSVNENWNIVLYNSNLHAKEGAGSTLAQPWRRRGSTVAHITKLLQNLDINTQKIKRRRNRSIVPYRVRKQDQNALVLYQQDGSIVPFEGPFNPASRRRQRARVDLDDETTRVWRLLLENIDNEGVNGTDEDKAKWWDNERRVFRGRVDSFIARMRLVQGDRRFTPWKGSVLDSVIGVFLTQNVSDHLSSSAFMSMAARFPLKPESPGSTLSEESTSPLFVEPEISVIEPEESITWNEKPVGQPTLDKNSRAIFYFDHSEEKEVVNSSETCQRASIYSRGYNATSQSPETETVYLLGEDKAKDDATSSQQSVISSQNSINSLNQQTVGIMNTFSESNSTTQAVSSSSKFNCLDHTASFMGLLKMAEGSIHHQSYTQTQVENPPEGIKYVTEYCQEAPGVSSSNYQMNLGMGFHLRDAQGIDMLEESRSSDTSRKDENSPTTEQSNLTSEITDQEKNPNSYPRTALNMSSCYILEGDTMVVHSQMQNVKEPLDTVASSVRAKTSPSCNGTHVPLLSSGMTEVIGSTREELEKTRNNGKEVKQNLEHNYGSSVVSNVENTNPSKTGTEKTGQAKKTDSNWDRLRRDAVNSKKTKKNEFDWDSLRRDAQVNGKKPERPANTRDSLDWDAVLHAKASDIAETIKERGMNNVLAGRIKDLLDRLVRDHGSIDMEWLREIPPDKAKEYLLSFRGLGLKSVECVRLLTLHHMAFPVDTNVGRIAVRLGWVPLQPLPESLQLHLLEMYPILESIQQYLWPRLCKLDQKTLYELHYHMITFGKVFCTKRQPNCNACPLRGECRHFASAFASARFALPGPEDKSIVPVSGNTTPHVNPQAGAYLLPSTASWDNQNPHPNTESYATALVQGPSFPMSLPLPQTVHLERRSINSQCEPIVEVPASPEQETQHEQALCDIEDAFYEDPEEIPTINLNMKEFAETLQNFMLQEAGMSNALVALTAEAASIPTPKLKNINRLRTEHHVYELPDTHPLIQGMEKREPDDPCSYLLAIWTPGETADSIDPPERRCRFDDPSMLCNEETCFYCSSHREASSQTVRGTLLIPTRTAMRGSFPLNGTYFQVNEVFADHASSLNPIAVPRSWLWNLPRRTVYFGSSIPTIFKGLSTEDIQHCFWRGYVCVRGFDQKTRAPRPLMARLHFPASRIVRGAKGKPYEEE